MNLWEVLGIPPTSEESSVKKAYAKLLKSGRPEDNMQAFQTLRIAYEQALAICRGSKKSTEKQDFRAEGGETNEDLRPLQDLHLPFTASDFMDQFTALANDYSSYPNQTLWQTFLNKAYDLNYWERMTLGSTLALSLHDYQLLPSYIWVKLEELFNWEQHRGLLKSQYHDADLDCLKRMGQVARLLRTEEILPCLGGPEYLSALSRFYAHRDAIENVVINNQLHGLYVERDELPAALRLHFSLLKSVGDWKTLSEPHKLFKGCDSDHFLSLLHGEALRHMEDYAGARNAYEDILKQQPNHAAALRWSALCMERMGDASSAAMRYRSVLDISPDDVYARCAIQRLTASHADKHSTWRSWFFPVLSAFWKFLLFAAFAVWCLYSVFHFFTRILPLM